MDGDNLLRAFSLKTRLIFSYGGILLVVMFLVACVSMGLVVARFRTLASQTADSVRARWLVEQSIVWEKLDRVLVFSESAEARTNLVEGEASPLLMECIRANRERLGLDLLAAVGKNGDWAIGQIGRAHGDGELPFRFSGVRLPELNPGERATMLMFQEMQGKKMPFLCRALVVTRWSGGPKEAYVVGGVFLEDLFRGTVLPCGSELVFRPSQGEPIPLQSSLAREDRSHSSLVRLLRPLFTLSLQEPLDPGDDPLGNLEIFLTDEHALGTAAELLWALLILFLSGTAVACLAAIYLARSVTDPIDELSRAARNLAMGLDVEEWEIMGLDSERGDEIGLLMASFKEMAEQIHEQQEQRLRAERLAAWREMARRVAHEIKNPLTPIQLSMENLRRNAPVVLDEPFQRLLGQCCQTVLEEVGRLRRYVDEFSRFARMPKPILAPCDMVDAVRSTARTYTTGVEGIELCFSLPQHKVYVMADRQQIEMAVANLLKNALEAMFCGGKLDVSLWSDDKDVFLQISDTGEGMSKEMLRRLFEPYVTTKESGAGLGMAIVQNVVSEHHGRVDVHSQQGQGTRVTITLPRWMKDNETTHEQRDGR